MQKMVLATLVFILSVVLSVEEWEMKKKRKIVRLGFVVNPSNSECKSCGGLLWLRFAYFTPWYWTMARGYGPCRNEMHCRKCHKEELQRERSTSPVGNCFYCDWGK